MAHKGGGGLLKVAYNYLWFWMTGKCCVELPPPKAESTPRNRSAMQYKVHTVLEIRPGLLSPLKPKIASPK